MLRVQPSRWDTKAQASSIGVQALLRKVPDTRCYKHCEVFEEEKYKDEQTANLHSNSSLAGNAMFERQGDRDLHISVNIVTQESSRFERQ